MPDHRTTDAGNGEGGMRVGSLFAGIGGFDLAFEREGFEVAWQVEIDPFCRRVLAKHWPNVRRHDDIRTFPTLPIEQWECDVICGGFPCQDVSTAGTGRGLDGSRSGLYREVLRIVCQLRPRFLLLENVAGLFVDGRIGTVLGDLAAIGFDSEWDCIPAAAVGAHHIRDRVFILAYPQCGKRTQGLLGGNGRALGGTSLATSSQRTTSAIQSSYCGQGVSIWPDSDESGADDATDCIGLPERPALAERWMVEPELDRVADGLPNWMDRLHGLGNAIVPQVAQWIARRIKEAA